MHEGIEYSETRPQNGDGCNHYENIPSVADYMGQAIRKRIKEDVSYYERRRELESIEIGGDKVEISASKNIKMTRIGE